MDKSEVLKNMKQKVNSDPSADLPYIDSLRKNKILAEYDELHKTKSWSQRRIKRHLERKFNFKFT